MDTFGILLLASGLSRRFGKDDKLLAPLNGAPLGSYAGRLFDRQRNKPHCVVIPEEGAARADLFRGLGWHVLINPAPELGQGHSLAIGVNYLQSTDVTSALVLLADMPFVTEAYLHSMIQAHAPETAMMSVCGNVLQPPAIFPRSAFSQLSKACGDSGAKAIFGALPKTKTHPISAQMARDIDTQASLASAQENQLHV